MYTRLMLRKLLMMLPLVAGLALAQNHIYELRTYTCYEGKLEALKTRFRDHTIRHLQAPRHGKPRLLGAPGRKFQNDSDLHFVHPSIEAAKKHWDDFRADPEWKKVSADSEANGKIVQKVESVFMEPTDFSKLK